MRERADTLHSSQATMTGRQALRGNAALRALLRTVLDNIPASLTP